MEVANSVFLRRDERLFHFSHTPASSEKSEMVSSESLEAASPFALERKGNGHLPVLHTRSRRQDVTLGAAVEKDTQMIHERIP